ncbi:MAG: hypothetical protein AAGG44_17905, partial [Planctomycetota bacterium]
PKVMAIASNPRRHVASPRWAGDRDHESGASVERQESSGTLATQIASLDPAIRASAVEQLKQRGWRDEHIDLARRFLRAPLAMKNEIVESLSRREDLNVVPWFLWMLEVAESELASKLMQNLTAAATPRDTPALRATAGELERYREPLTRLADVLEQRRL